MKYILSLLVFFGLADSYAGLASDIVDVVGEEIVHEPSNTDPGNGCTHT